MKRCPHSPVQSCLLVLFMFHSRIIFTRKTAFLSPLMSTNSDLFHSRIMIIPAPNCRSGLLNLVLQRATLFLSHLPYLALVMFMRVPCSQPWTHGHSSCSLGALLLRRIWSIRYWPDCIFLGGGFGVLMWLCPLGEGGLRSLGSGELRTLVLCWGYLCSPGMRWSLELLRIGEIVFPPRGNARLLGVDVWVQSTSGLR